jgi:hypothetical protein
MKNYNIDFAKNTITVSEAFMKKAGQLGTTEFTTMMELRKLNMTIVVKEAKPRKKPEFQLTYKKMEAFIRCSENAEALMAEFERVKEASIAQNNPYRHVQKWFEKTFPNFSKVPEFTPDRKIVATPANYDEEEAA